MNELKRMRVGKGLTIEELSDIVDIPVSIINVMENINDEDIQSITPKDMELWSSVIDKRLNDIKEKYKSIMCNTPTKRYDKTVDFDDSFTYIVPAMIQHTLKPVSMMDWFTFSNDELEMAVKYGISVKMVDFIICHPDDYMDKISLFDENLVYNKVTNSIYGKYNDRYTHLNLSEKFKNDLSEILDKFNELRPRTKAEKKQETLNLIEQLKNIK